jgi:hypothetical protein
MAKDLTQTVNNWVNAAGSAQQAFVTGVEGTSVDPTQLAIASEGALLANFAQAVQSGRWRRALAAVGKAGWQAATVAKAQNYSTGIQAGRTAYETAMSSWLPFIQQTATGVRSMPSGTLAQNLARANAFATALYNRKRGI